MVGTIGGDGGDHGGDGGDHGEMVGLSLPEPSGLEEVT